MSPAVTSAEAPFVVAHASGLHAVARELDKLHREALRIGGENEQKSVRLSVLNLVAACTSVDDADLASQTVGHLAQTHPCRAVIIYAEPESADSIEADLSLQCALTPSGEICAEQIRLNVYGEPAYHLASVVTPLLVPNIPIYLWLVAAPPLAQAFGHDAIAMCERIIIDSGEYEDAAATLTTLANEIGTGEEVISLADLSWARTRIWREVISQAFDGPEMRPFVRRITRVEVESCGRSPSSQAWLCAGWLGDRLGWQSEGGPYVICTAAEVDGVPEHELSAIRLTCVGKDHSATVTLERREQTLYTTIDVDGGITASRALEITTSDVAHLVGSLLEEGSDDPVYVHALRSAAMLART